ncbi:hypothetical protein CHARACLAT_002324 [Characodon lateralis]|uniref:Uncharacterized protein n=1 Tax=Characodon lateralis TaxID=208331 RepID=A0ABU7CUL8_9TELE|nr:hypothetical protein [Characodon lateralis]
MKQKDTVTGGGRRHTERTNLQSVPAVRTRTERRFDTLTCLDPSGPTETKLDFLFLQQETANLSGSRRTGTAGDDGPESPMEEAQTAKPPQKERVRPGPLGVSLPPGVSGCLTAAGLTVGGFRRPRPPLGSIQL